MARVNYIGHATVLIEMDGARLLTDPLLRVRVSYLSHPGRWRAPAVDQKIDAVLLSHLHHDHADLPSLRQLGRDVTIIAPQGAGDFLHRQGFTAIQEVRAGQELTLGELRVEATPALHNGERRFGPATEPLGYVIAGSRRIYFAGDTDLFPAMADFGGDLDLALLPVWGWGPTLGVGHMNPERAAQALTLLRPRLAIPIHSGRAGADGLHWLRPRFLVDPPLAFQRHAAMLAPEVQVRILQPGEALALADGGET